MSGSRSGGSGGVHFAIPEGTASITGLAAVGEGEDPWVGWGVDKTKVTSVTIPTSVTSIGDNAFAFCDSLTSVVIPTSVTKIGEDAFCGCHSLTRVDIPTSVTSIGGSAFYKCTSLASVVIPTSVTSIGDFVFCFCISLTSVVVPTSVTSIGRHAFWGCRSMASVVIPTSVTSIGYNTFKDCGSITTVLVQPSAYVDSNSAVWGKLFDSCMELVENVDKSDSDDDKEVEEECEQLFPDTTKIWAPDNIVAQLTGQFKDCKRFANVPRALRAAPDAKTWAGVQLWLWWLPPTSISGGSGGDGGSSGNTNAEQHRVVCRSRVATIWTTMLAGLRTKKTATLPRLPEDLWLYMFGFLKHDQKPTFSIARG